MWGEAASRAGSVTATLLLRGNPRVGGQCQPGPRQRGSRQCQRSPLATLAADGATLPFSIKAIADAMGWPIAGTRALPQCLTIRSPSTAATAKAP